MRCWLRQWFRWTPLYECVCGYQPETHLHMLWHRLVATGPLHWRT